MKIYIEQEDGALIIDNMTISGSDVNKDYRKAWDEVGQGLAVIDAWEGSKRQANQVP